MFPWGPLEDFLAGAAIGFIEDSYATCPYCGAEFLLDDCDSPPMHGARVTCPFCGEGFEIPPC